MMQPKSTDSGALLATLHLEIGYDKDPSRTWHFDTPLSLEAHPNRLIAIVGPNGAGKSTLLRTLAGLQQPVAGQVSLLGQNIHQLAPPDLARLRSYSSTHLNRPQWMSGREWVALGRFPYTGWLGALDARDDEAVDRALHAVNASYLSDRRLTACSDGEFQRLIVARCLCQDTPVVFMDEPLAHLDPPHKAEMISRLREQAHKSYGSILISIHDIDLAFRHADEIWVLGSDGSFTQGMPEAVLESPVLARAFRTNQVTFNSRTLTFEANPEQLQPLVFAGTHASRHIPTVHLLTRLGFRPVSPSDPSATDLPSLTFQPHPDGTPEWVLKPANSPTPEAISSIEALAAKLQRLPTSGNAS